MRGRHRQPSHTPLRRRHRAGPSLCAHARSPRLTSALRLTRRCSAMPLCGPCGTDQCDARAPLTDQSAGFDAGRQGLGWPQRRAPRLCPGLSLFPSLLFHSLLASVTLSSFPFFFAFLFLLAFTLALCPPPPPPSRIPPPPSPPPDMILARGQLNQPVAVIFAPASEQALYVSGAKLAILFALLLSSSTDVGCAATAARRVP